MIFWHDVRMKNEKNIIISGPYFCYSSPYGKAIESMNRDEWFVTKKLKPNEQKTEIQKITGDKCLGTIEKYRNQKNRYVVPQTYPLMEFKTLKKAVNYLVKNEGKIVFLT